MEQDEPETACACGFLVRREDAECGARKSLAWRAVMPEPTFSSRSPSPSPRLGKPTKPAPFVHLKKQFCLSWSKHVTCTKIKCMCWLPETIYILLRLDVCIEGLGIVLAWMFNT
jgi:hypothetical protein